MKKTPIIIIAVVAVVVMLGAIIAMAGRDDSGDMMSSSESMQSMDTNREANMSSDSSSTASTAEAIETDKVEITDFMYGPETIKVKVGTTVTWTNNDTVRHNVAGEGNDMPEGKLIGKGETYSYTFTKAGTYNYYCTPHPYMKASVIVE